MLPKEMIFLTILAFIAIPACGLRSDNYMYGYPCNSYSDCTSRSDFSILHELQCLNGRCNCSSDTAAMVEVRYNSDESRYECDSQIFSLFGGSGGADCEEKECGNNSRCVKGRKKWRPFVADYRCVCNDGFIEVSNECREVEQVSVGEVCSTPKTGPLQFCDINLNKSCIDGKCTCIRDYYNDPDIDACITKEDYIEKFKANLTVGLFETCNTKSVGLPSFCDEAANMTCIMLKCQCHKDFYYDRKKSYGTSLTCESKESFANEHNLTEYRVMPGMYCHTKRECIEGLTCHKNNCSCPYPCEFVYSSSACDCGKVSATEGASRAIVVGIIGGIVIIAGWWYLIKKQIRKGKGENYTATLTEGDTNCSNSNPASYPLQPSSNTSQTAGPAQQPSSSHQAASHSPSPAPALPHKHLPTDNATPFTPPSAAPSYSSPMSQPPPPYNPYDPQAAPPYTPPSYQQPTAPPTDSTTVPLTYQAPSSYPDASYPGAPYPGAASQPGAPYPGAPYTGEPYSSAPPYTGTHSQPDAPYPGAPAGSASGVPNDPPPAYTPATKPVDIYQPII